MQDLRDDVSNQKYIIATSIGSPYVVLLKEMCYGTEKNTEKTENS
jgi:hypothetical protein